MTKGSFRLVTLFNIPIEINFSWFIILGLVIFTLAHGYFPLSNPELGVGAHWLMAIIAALLLFLSLLAHELAHSLVAKQNNLSISGITLFVFGGVAHLGNEPASARVEFRMAVAGPLMSFSLSLLFWLLARAGLALDLPAPLLAITDYLVLVNLFVGLFNLIPGFPLDGGRILRAALWTYYRDVRKATAISSALGKAFAFFLIGYGFISLVTGAVISGIWFIFIGLFLEEAADLSYRQVAMRKLLTGVPVEKLMTKNVITVNAGLTLDKLIDDYFFKYRYTTFPVIEDDTLLGLVTIHDLKSVPKEQWPQFFARQLLVPITPALVIDKNADAMEALAKMAATGLGRLLVIENTKLIGILSQRDIMRLFEFKSEVGG